MKIFSTLLTVLALQLAFMEKCVAQEIPKPVKWSYTISPKTYKAGDVITIRFQGALENNWFIYSVDNDTLDYVSPAVFSFAPHNSFELQGKPSALNVVLHRDDMLEEDFKVVKNNAVFLQKAIVKKLPIRVDVRLDYTLAKDDDDEGTVVELQELFKIR